MRVFGGLATMVLLECFWFNVLHCQGHSSTTDRLQARAIQGSGINSLRRIARALAARRIRTARGGSWTPALSPKFAVRPGPIGLHTSHAVALHNDITVCCPRPREAAPLSAHRLPSQLFAIKAPPRRHQCWAEGSWAKPI